MSRWFLSAPVMMGYSGTSFSAPLVSLAFAMLCAAFPKFNLREVLKLMYVSAALPLRAHKTDLHDWLKITNMPYKSIKAMPVQLYYGGGVINVARAYEVGKMIQDLKVGVESLFVKDIGTQFSRKIQKTSWIGLKLEEFFHFKPNPKAFLKNMMNGLDKKEKYWGDKRRVLKKFVTDFGDKIDAFFKTEPLENNLKIASYYQNMRAFRKIYMPKTKVLKRKSEQL